MAKVRELSVADAEKLFKSTFLKLAEVAERKPLDRNALHTAAVDHGRADSWLRSAKKRVETDDVSSLLDATPPTVSAAKKAG